MSEYHKINSLFKRDMTLKRKPFIVGEFAEPEFEFLKDCRWEFTEKVDGTNVRVMIHNVFEEATQSMITMITFGGRGKDSQMPVTLMAKLNETFTVERVQKAFPDPGFYVLYGEGYGARIQKGGGNYIPDGVNFILFDVRVGDYIWLRRDSVEDIGGKLDIKVVPVVGHGTIAEGIEFVKSFKSTLRETAPEGIVLRPQVELRTRMGHRIITKLKVHDFL